jgi:hypothetical protein
VHDTTRAVPGLIPDAERLGLEDMVLAYLTRAAAVTAGAAVPTHAAQSLEAQR